MSNEPRWTQVCSSEESVTLDPNSYCGTAQAESASPIDEFYVYIQEILPLGKEDDLRNNNVLGRILLLGLVSGVELYFRSIIAKIISICPIARDHASKHLLSLASLDYYGPDRVGLGLLEGTSFATEGEIARQTDRLLGVKWNQNSSTDVAIKKFEMLCHLRHAAVHSRGELSSGNLRSLGIRDRQSRKALFVMLPQLHEAAVTCQSAVRAYNLYLYRKSVERWIAHGILSGAWQRDAPVFKPLFKVFVSKRDQAGLTSAFYVHKNLRDSIVQRAGR